MASREIDIDALDRALRIGAPGVKPRVGLGETLHRQQGELDVLEPVPGQITTLDRQGKAKARAARREARLQSLRNREQDEKRVAQSKADNLRQCRLSRRQSRAEGRKARVRGISNRPIVVASLPAVVPNGPN